MNWDNLDWEHFSCVDMARKIKDKIDAEIANVSIMEYLENCRANRYAKSRESVKQ